MSPQTEPAPMFPEINPLLTEKNTYPPILSHVVNIPPEIRPAEVPPAIVKSSKQKMEKATPREIAKSNSLFQIDQEISVMMETIELEIKENGQASDEAMDKFQTFLLGMNEKVDRIGAFIQNMQYVENCTRDEGNRLLARATAAANRIKQTKNFVRYYMVSRNLDRMEGTYHTIRVQNNGQDSLVIDENAIVPEEHQQTNVCLPTTLWKKVLASLSKDLLAEVETFPAESTPDKNSIRVALLQGESIDGARLVRNQHLRVS